MIGQDSFDDVKTKDIYIYIYMVCIVKTKGGLKIYMWSVL